MIFKYCITCTQYIRFMKHSDGQETYLLTYMNNFDGIIEYEEEINKYRLDLFLNKSIKE